MSGKKKNPRDCNHRDSETNQSKMKGSDTDSQMMVNTIITFYL